MYTLLFKWVTHLQKHFRSLHNHKYYSITTALLEMVIFLPSQRLITLKSFHYLSSKMLSTSKFILNKAKLNESQNLDSITRVEWWVFTLDFPLFKSWYSVCVNFIRFKIFVYRISFQITNFKLSAKGFNSVDHCIPN